MDKGKIKELFIETGKQVNLIGFWILASFAIVFLFSLGAIDADSIRETKIIAMTGFVIVYAFWSIVAMKCLSIQETLRKISDRLGEE